MSQEWFCNCNCCKVPAIVNNHLKFECYKAELFSSYHANIIKYLQGGFSFLPNLQLTFIASWNVSKYQNNMTNIFAKLYLLKNFGTELLTKHLDWQLTRINNWPFVVYRMYAICVKLSDTMSDCMHWIYSGWFAVISMASGPAAALS